MCRTLAPGSRQFRSSPAFVASEKIYSSRLSTDVFERVKEFLRADAGGAQFADHDAGRGIGKHGGIGQRRPRRDGKSHNAENRVPCSSDVEDLAARRAALHAGLANASVSPSKTPCRNVQMAWRGFFKYAHSLFTASNHHRSATEMRKQRAGCLFHGLLVGQRARHVARRFLSIANDSPRAAIRV